MTPRVRPALFVAALSVWSACGPPAADSDSSASPAPSARVAILADSHIIDSFYTCCESNDRDTTSLQESESRLIEARARINALDPLPGIAVVAGDVVHEFPSDDRAFYDENETSMDIAKRVYDGFEMPVHFSLGNHDYAVPELPRSLTEELVRDKWGMEKTYSAVEVAGTRWLLLDGQAGPTWDPEDPAYERSFASFGPEQLAWVDGQLSDGMPTFLVFHHPPNFVLRNESTGPHPDLFAVIDAHGDAVEAVFTGHMHIWLDTGAMWNRPGYGLAATRFDPRNWWVMDIDPDTLEWSIPESDAVTWGSFFYDGEEPVDGASLRRVEDPGDLRALLEDERERRQALGWACRAPREIPGHGWVADCDKPGANHHLLTATTLRGDGWVGFAPQHDYAVEDQAWKAGHVAERHRL